MRYKNLLDFFIYILQRFKQDYFNLSMCKVLFASLFFFFFSILASSKMKSSIVQAITCQQYTHLLMSLTTVISFCEILKAFHNMQSKLIKIYMAHIRNFSVVYGCKVCINRKWLKTKVTFSFSPIFFNCKIQSQTTFIYSSLNSIISNILCYVHIYNENLQKSM